MIMIMSSHSHSHTRSRTRPFRLAVIGRPASCLAGSLQKWQLSCFNCCVAAVCVSLLYV